MPLNFPFCPNSEYSPAKTAREQQMTFTSSLFSGESCYNNEARVVQSVKVNGDEVSPVTAINPLVLIPPLHQARLGQEELCVA